jgi:hypothetical protein
LGREPNHEVFFMHSPSRSLPGLWPGLILVSLGGGLLARELGLLPPGVRIVDFWPLAIVVFGLAQLAHARGAFAAFFALAFTAAGSVLLAGNLGLGEFTAARYWPALLILLGLSFLFRGRGARRGRGVPPARFEGTPPPKFAGSREAEQLLVSDENRLVRSIIMAGGQIRVESQAFTGGEVSAVAAGAEIDFRYARLAEAGATLHLDVVMGGVEIRVPDTWHVVCDVSPVLGGVDDTTRPTQGDSSAPQLRIVGSVVLGGVSVRN